MAIHNWDYAPEALEVQVSELLLATADRSDELVDENVRLVLQELRQHLNMEVIFVSEIRNGQRMFQHVDTAPARN
jgi:electron transfer flavoprotein alpha subunit